MEGAVFIVSKDMAHLIDVFAIGAQQALHPILRRGMKVSALSID